MTKQEYEKLYSKLTSKLSNDELRQLDILLSKIKIKDEDIRILNAFYMPGDGKKIPALEELSPSQMKYELRNLFVLLKNNDSGYDFFNKEGKLDDLRKVIEKKVNDISNNMKTRDYFAMIAEDLNTVIKDNHISFDCNGEVFVTGIFIVPYFADVIVEKIDNKFVVENDNDYFDKGYIIKENIDKYLFKTLPGEYERFLIGILKDVNVDSTKSITIDGVTLPLHKSKSADIRFNEPNHFVDYDDYKMLVLTKCKMDENVNYIDYGKKLLDGKCSVISVVGNPGGSSIMCSQIIEGLNGNGTWNVESTTMNVYQYSNIPYRYYSSGSDEPIADGTYEKELYILMNKNTASAGESLVSISNNVKKVIKVGTNTMGCGEFGEAISYVLPQSHVTIRLPFKVFYMEGFHEGIGFSPDYWLDTDNIIEIFNNWLVTHKE